MNPQQPPQNPGQLPPANPNVTTGQTLGPDQVISAIEQSRQQMGQRIADIPNIYAQNDPAKDPTVNDYQGQYKDKMQQLFSHDSQLAQTYFPIQNAPGPSTGNVTMPANNQAIVDPTIGYRASSTQTKATAQELGDILTKIAQRKDEIHNATDKAIQMLTLGLMGDIQSLEALTQEYTVGHNKSQDVIDLLKTIGGAVPDDVAGSLGLAKGTKIPSELQRALALKSADYTLNPSYRLATAAELESLAKAYPSMGAAIRAVANIKNPDQQKAALDSILTTQNTKIALAQTPLETTVTRPPSWLDRLFNGGTGPTTVQKSYAQPGGSASLNGDLIRVRLKSTGATGSVPASEFNPSLYDKLQ